MYERLCGAETTKGKEKKPKIAIKHKKRPIRVSFLSFSSDLAGKIRYFCGGRTHAIKQHQNKADVCETGVNAKVA